MGKKKVLASSLPCHEANFHAGMWWRRGGWWPLSSRARWCTGYHSSFMTPIGEVHALGVLLRSLRPSWHTHPQVLWALAAMGPLPPAPGYLSQGNGNCLAVHYAPEIHGQWLTDRWEQKAQLPCLKMGPTAGGNSCSRVPGGIRLKWASASLLSLTPWPLLPLPYPATLPPLHLRDALSTAYLYKKPCVGLYFCGMLPKARVINDPREPGTEGVSWDMGV